MITIAERVAQLRGEDPHGRRSTSELERQARIEDIRADIEIASDIEELRRATLRLADYILDQAS